MVCIRHAPACGFKHARACGLALVLTPTKDREPLPGMAYSAYTECDTLPSLSIIHSCYYTNDAIAIGFSNNTNIIMFIYYNILL